MCPLGQMTSNSINRGLAAMPVQERSLRLDGRGLGGDQPYNQRRHREAMARNTSPQELSPRADGQPPQWDDADWEQDHDEAPGHRAPRLLSRSGADLPRLRHAHPALRRQLAGGTVVDAEVAVRITPDGYVTVSTGDNTRPLATGVASKRQPGVAPSSSGQAASDQPALTLPVSPIPPPPSAPSGTTAVNPGNRDAASRLLAGLDWPG